jgi:hypothetical protein
MKTWRRLYEGAFLLLAVFIIAINVVSFLAGLDKKQLANMFYLPERAVASFLLAEHIVFESGLFLDSFEQAELEEHISSACAESGVDPNLVRMMIPKGTRSNYIIHTDGSIGIMRVKPIMFETTEAVDPFSYKSNINIGVAYLSKLLRESYDVEQALERYYAPTSKTIFEKDVARMFQHSQGIRHAYEAIGGKNRLPAKVLENAGVESDKSIIPSNAP